jgi:hypothetical protein
MRKIRYYTPLIILFLIIASIKFTGCEQEDLDYYIDCDSCLIEIPDWDTLVVQLTINDENPVVPLEFFIGDYENGEVDWIDTARTERFWLTGEVGVEYSVKATYISGDEIILAIDGDKIRIVDGEADCGSPCFYTRGGTMDCRLKE